MELALVGRWSVRNTGQVEKRLAALVLKGADELILDLGRVEYLDTAGAWLAHRTAQEQRQRGVAVIFAGLDQDRSKLLEQVAANDRHAEGRPPKHPQSLVQIMDRVGRSLCFCTWQSGNMVGFLGMFLAVVGRWIVRPGRIRVISLVHHMEHAGFNAVPIVSLISFLIGVVLAFMGAQELERFGAQVFVVNLIEVAMFRELGILLTSVVVAGRSGSAFTAQIGTMKVNQEVDAMRSMGLDPMEVLAAPRILALMIMLPLLGFIADIMGLLGGGLMCWSALDIDPGVFLERIRQSTYMGHFWAGLIKAPFFALAIGLVGCFEGFKVTGSAESVGAHTTRSVVESIFIVIIMDAVFAMFFSVLGV